MTEKMTGHKAHAAALAGTVIPAGVALLNEYAKLGWDTTLQGLVTAAGLGVASWLIVYFVPNRVKK